MRILKTDRDPPRPEILATNDSCATLTMHRGISVQDAKPIHQPSCLTALKLPKEEGKISPKVCLVRRERAGSGKLVGHPRSSWVAFWDEWAKADEEQENPWPAEVRSSG